MVEGVNGGGLEDLDADTNFLYNDKKDKTALNNTTNDPRGHNQTVN